MSDKRRKIRSPSFPFISLRVALDRVRAFQAKESRNAAPLEVAAEHWGYSPKSSGGKQTIAALRAFGLLEGESTVRLTDRALRILLDEREPSPERDRLLQEAALMPPLHAKLWERYGTGLPSPQTLRMSLVLDEGFNENSVDDFVAQYRETLEFARLGKEEGTMPEQAPLPSLPPAPRPTDQVDPVTFPLLDGNAVEFRIRRRVSQEEAEELRPLFEMWLRKIVR